MLFGTDEEVAESIALRAGPLALTVRGARVWDIRCGEHEVWHGIAFLFRDADWGTPEPIVDKMESTISESAFLLRITGRFGVAPAIDFDLRIEGADSGRLLGRSAISAPTLTRNAEARAIRVFAHGVSTLSSTDCRTDGLPPSAASTAVASRFVALCGEHGQRHDRRVSRRSNGRLMPTGQVIKTGSPRASFR